MIGSEVRVTVRDIFSVEENRVRMTVYFLQESVPVTAEAILDEDYGIMIGVINGKIKRVPLAECAGKLKMVSPKRSDRQSCQTDRYQLRRLTGVITERTTTAAGVFLQRLNA